MLQFKQVNYVDVGDFDTLVQETYGRPYNFQQQDGCKERGIEEFSVPCKDPWDYENDSIEEKINGDEMGVSFKAWLARDPKQPVAGDDRWIDLFWERNFYPSLDMVVNDLHGRGLIPAGHYMIIIDW